MARDAGARGRRPLPGWLTGTGWAIVGLSAAGLPVALVVAGLDLVRREGTTPERGVVLAGLVLGAVVLVVGIERGLVHAASEDWSAGTIGGILAAVVAVVVAGVLVPPLGLVLVALGVVIALLAAPAGLGLLAWWRWNHGPRQPPRERPSPADVRARAEERRAAVRARHDATREAVAAGYIGPGFTRRP